MSPELKLKTAAEEIKDILRKHDIAASIVLHTPGHGEYLNHILTSYSCAYQYQDDSIHFYSKKKDFKSVEEQAKQQGETANMLHILSKLTGENFMMLHSMSEKFDSITNAEHFNP
ncbi:hypothetical protein [Flagellimonas nanhaiensis]|uniref:Uncharacterized protein n=1 Tax=Flagellimonas nanhaiensis TaxID=2292706 RepID=A0A371JL60_9FLAO|nr:hypothetical protein [Allomuricauda nanhaiensis]RDY57697.1 hypothetical protein DX873_17505 [Allomuricauda nanhaiensis]